MKLPLEDNFADVLSKAATGLGLNASGLSRQTGISPHTIQRVTADDWDEPYPRERAAFLTRVYGWVFLGVLSFAATMWAAGNSS